MFESLKMADFNMRVEEFKKFIISECLKNHKNDNEIIIQEVKISRNGLRASIDLDSNDLDFNDKESYEKYIKLKEKEDNFIPLNKEDLDYLLINGSISIEFDYSTFTNLSYLHISYNPLSTNIYYTPNDYKLSKVNNIFHNVIIYKSDNVNIEEYENYDIIHVRNLFLQLEKNKSNSNVIIDLENDEKLLIKYINLFLDVYINNKTKNYIFTPITYLDKYSNTNNKPIEQIIDTIDKAMPYINEGISLIGNTLKSLDKSLDNFLNKHNKYKIKDDDDDFHFTF